MPSKLFSKKTFLVYLLTFKICPFHWNFILSSGNWTILQYNACMYYKCVACSRIVTLYTKSLPLDVACRVWDMFCRDGDVFLFRTALGQLPHQECNSFYYHKFITERTIPQCKRPSLGTTSSVHDESQYLGLGRVILLVTN